MSHLITANTRAIIAVSLFSAHPDLSRHRQDVEEAEQKFGTIIALVADGAQNFGTIGHG